MDMGNSKVEFIFEVIFELEKGATGISWIQRTIAESEIKAPDETARARL